MSVKTQPTLQFIIAPLFSHVFCLISSVRITIKLLWGLFNFQKFYTFKIYIYTDKYDDLFSTLHKQFYKYLSYKNSKKQTLFTKGAKNRLLCAQIFFTTKGVLEI